MLDLLWSDPTKTDDVRQLVAVVVVAVVVVVVVIGVKAN